MGKRRFTGQVVVITGASAGIGAAAAHQFAAEGAHVVLAARGVEALESTAASIRAAGGAATVQPTDIGDDPACRALVEATISNHGRLDVLVNNAGLHHRGAFLSHPAEALADMVHVNLRSPVLLTRLALTPMIAAGRGSVVNVASLAGCVPLADAATYSATKWGLRALSLALAQELLDTGVRVSVVSPGPVSTGFILDDLDTVSPLTLSQPMSTPEQVAKQVLDCAADGRPERRLPWASGKLATAAYLMPRLGRGLRPLLRRKGERAKARLRQELAKG